MNNHNIRSRGPSRSGSTGFALIEALVALLVVAFGMMAIAAFQYTLSRSSDVAKQRTEATRIAEHEIDRLRSFAARGADGIPGDPSLTYTEDLIAGTVPFYDVPNVTSNTVFQMQRIISAPTAPVPTNGETFRWINVVVRWDDRTGAEQRVTLSTAISDGAPGDLGGLSTGRGLATTLRPRNRNINIPYPAVNLAGGVTSAFTVPPNNVVFIFDNETGRVIGRCGSISPPAEGDTLTPATSGCTQADAYILSGYVRFKTSNPAADRDNIDDPTNNLIDPTKPLVPTVPGALATDPLVSQPLTITSTATGYAPDPSVSNPYECYAQEQATLRNNAGFEINVAIDPATGVPYTSGPLVIPAGYNFNGNPPRFIAYMCIVTPIDHDGDGNGAGSTPKIWSGEVTLNAEPSGSRSWVIDNGGSNFRVCRFTSDYNRNGVLSNGEHPRYYRRVSAALDNQNYLVLNRNDVCPPDTRADPANGNYQDTNSAGHQPTSIAELSFRCDLLTNNGPGSNTCSNANKSTFEPALGAIPVAALPME